MEIRPAEFKMKSEMETEKASEHHLHGAFPGSLGVTAVGCHRIRKDR
jgi:hypothetical protein